MEYKVMNKVVCGKIAGEIEEELQTYGYEHGVQITRGNAKFSPEGWMELTIRVALKDAQGNVVSKEAAAFKELAEIYDLKPEDLGREFRNQGKTFTITGLKTRSPKYPILARCKEDGRTYKFPEKLVAAKLAILDKGPSTGK